MNIKYFFIFLVPSLFAYNNIYKNNFANSMNNYDHLDPKNSEKLQKIEQMFYLRNNRYSPFRNMIYSKYHNMTNSNITNDKYVNVTKIFENINQEYIKSLQEQSIIEDDIDNDTDNDIPKRNSEKNGYFDPIGVFRYNRPESNRPEYNKPESNNEYSNDNNFEIIKNPTHTFKDVGGYDKIKT